MVFRHFFVPYLFDRRRNNRRYKKLRKFWCEKMFRKPHLMILRPWNQHRNLSNAKKSFRGLSSKSFRGPRISLTFIKFIPRSPRNPPGQFLVKFFMRHIGKPSLRINSIRLLTQANDGNLKGRLQFLSL